MLANKYIKFLLVTLLLTPVAIFAQNKEEVVDYYITKDGKKTVIVEEGLTLQSKKAQFLYDKSDNIKKTSRYSGLTEAVAETEMLSALIDTVQKYSQPATSLGFSQSRKNLELLRQERELSRGTNSQNTSLEEMLFLKKKYGDRPSFFINGTEVDQQMANKIMDRDILSKEVLVQNTATGNPNGEIRYIVSQKTLARLGLVAGSEEYSELMMDSDIDIAHSRTVERSLIDEKLGEIQENDRILREQMLEMEKLKREIEEKKQRMANEEQYNNKYRSQKKTYGQVAGNYSQESRPRTERVYRYGEATTANVRKETAKQESVDEEVFVIRQADWKKTEDLNTDDNKRSIRDIKEKDRNR